MIADFGFAKRFNKNDEYMRQTQCGTPMYMSPQVLNNKTYSYKIDYWALGIMYYQLLLGFSPFKATSLKVLKHDLEIAEYSFPAD